jgi:putative PIN family toxin of toxin-antitoxin system
MRLVVDTNVFSAVVKESSWPSYTLCWIDRCGGLLKSVATEGEVLAFLQRPRIAQRTAMLVLENVRRVLAAAELVAITEVICACRDRDDDKFLELAVAGQADVIISGDDDLLSLDSFPRHPDRHASCLWTRPANIGWTIHLRRSG